MEANRTIKLLNLHEEQMNHSRLDLTDKNLEIKHLKQRIKQLTAEIEYYKEVCKSLNVNDINLVDELNSSFKATRDLEISSLPEPTFIQRLQASFDELSSNDLRICALLRENLSTKEIAGQLGVSPDSANKARYRIRKKLSLRRNQPLVNFILSF